MNILSNLNHGWCDFKLEEFYGTPSYIQYIPMIILNAWEEYQNNGHCMIEFDEESSEFCVVIGGGYLDKAVILSHRYGRTKFYPLKIGGKELLRQLVADVISNVELWAKWCTLGENYSDIKNELQTRIHNLGLD